MGQVTPWRYSSTGNESTERATGRYPWSRFLFDPPPRPPNASNLLFDIHSRYSLHETGFFHESTCRHNPLRLPPDLVVDGASCHLGRFYDSTIGVRVRARKSRGGGADGRGARYRAVCRVSGNVSCLAGGCRLSGMYSVLVRSLASCRD